MRNLVVRAELSPQTEEILYQKISAFGTINTFRVKISDLEATTLLEIYGENNPSEKSVRGLFNRDVAFRIKSTKELLLFDKNGIWNEEGINHPLLLWSFANIIQSILSNLNAKISVACIHSRFLRIHYFIFYLAACWLSLFYVKLTDKRIILCILFCTLVGGIFSSPLSKRKLLKSTLFWWLVLRWR